MSDNRFSHNYFEVIEKYKSLHTNGTKKLSASQTFAGHSLVKWVLKIKEIILSNNSKTIIDYGCGKAFLYNNKISIKNHLYKNLQEFWELEKIFLYDPAVEKYSEQPSKKADGIICTDVIEHIPEKDVHIFIDNLFKLTNKFVFLVIATIPATKYFDDGRNIHLCLKTEKEWGDLFFKFRKAYPNIDQYIFFNNNS